MALTGEAFWKVTNGARGVSNVELLKSGDVAVVEEYNGRITYSHKGTNYGPESIRHIKLWHRPAELRGEGPLQRHILTIRQALDLQRYADTWFTYAAVPTGVLTTTEYLAEDAALANKEAFIKSQSERTIAVLSSGLKYDMIALNPEEAQFLENQKFMARQIALMFGVPTMYLGLSIEGQGMTYTNGNEDRAKLYEDGLQQYIVRIEKALTDLLPRGQRAKFNLTEFLRPNQLNRYQAYQIGLNNNFLTVGEIREAENLPSLEEIENLPIEPAVDQQTV
jgi:HK97 family phage portal protein